MEGLTRRRVLLGGVAIAGVAAAGAVSVGIDGVRHRIAGVRGIFDGDDPGCIPDAAVGQIVQHRRHSAARGREVDLVTIVPAGQGDGAGLPVVVLLHGASARPHDLGRFGYGQFVSHVSAATNQPFVLAAADGDRLRWEPHPGDNPQAMVADEMPKWLAQLGFDSTRRALLGWSMGGFGVLHLAQTHPGFARAAAVFSPAIEPGDAVMAHVQALGDLPLGVWCGTEDPYLAATRDLVAHLPHPAKVASFTSGGHTQHYWNCHTVEALTLLAGYLHQ